MNKKEFLIITGLIISIGVTYHFLSLVEAVQ